MKGIAVIGGRYPSWKEVSHLFGTADSLFVVAADSGIHPLAEWNQPPDLWLGDMDSCREDDLNRLNLSWLETLETRKFPVDKDYTDTELALRVLLDQGCDSLVIVGGGGGRTDHTLAIRALFQNPAFRGLEAWYPGGEVIFPLEGCWEWEEEPGRRISFFPLERPLRFSSRGLVWDIEDGFWNSGDMSISNRFDTSRGIVTVKEGRILAVKEWGGSLLE